MAISERKKQPFKVLHRIALEKAREIHESPIEKLYSIDEYGDCYYAEGDAEKVRPTQAMIERGIIDVHNHPAYLKTPISFSGEDVYTLLESPQKKEIIVSGYGFYFWMRKGTCIKNSAEVCTHINEMREEIRINELKKIPLNISKKLSRKLFKEHIINTEIVYHKALAKYAREIGLTYGKAKL